MTRAAIHRYRMRIMRAANAIEHHLRQADFYSRMGMFSAADYQRVCAHLEAECAMRASRQLAGVLA